MQRRNRISAAGLAALLVAFLAWPAQAGVSPQDGYGPDGSYQTHVELDFYGWLPGTSGNVALGRGADVSVSQGIPTVSELANVLTGAFMGTGRVRYGPWSGVLDIEYIGLSQTTGLTAIRPGVTRSLTIDSSMTRIAPGIGYQVFNQALGTIPATLDAQAGFAWFGTSTTLNLDSVGPFGTARTTSVSGSGGLVQPWMGLRGAIYPGPRWRLELGVLVQGFGVDGGIWGWGSEFAVTWAATKWLNLYAGFRALSSGQNYGGEGEIRSIRLIEYGPLLGIGFTF